jgi:hypothetical protein
MITRTCMVLLGLGFVGLACSRPEPPATKDGAEVSPAPEANEAPSILACQKALMAARQAPPEARSLLVARGCQNLFPPGPCREVLGGFGSIPPDERAKGLLDACLRPACKQLTKSKPRLCGADGLQLDPAARLAAMRELQLRVLQERVCPDLPEPKPALCSQAAPPASAAGQQVMLLEFQRALGDDISPRIRSLVMGFGLVASLASIKVEAPGPPKTLALKPRPALRVHLQKRDPGLWIHFPDQGARGWALPAKPGPDDLTAALAGLKDSPLKPRVTVSATKDVPYAAVVALMDALQKVGFDQITIAPMGH